MEKQIEKTRENTRKKAEQISENIAERAEEAKKAEKEQDKTGIIVVRSDTNKDKAERLLAEKLENAEDGRILLDNDDMQKIIEAAREHEEGQADEKQGDRANEIVSYLDLKI